MALIASSIRLPPRAPEIANSIRGVGYTTGAAIADLIDNSIAANASHIRIDFLWDPTAPRIRIADNGRGMAGVDLIDAMRLGADSSKKRQPGDLGRFGFGLKTASFSQARALIVSSKPQDGPTTTVEWDLDTIEASDDWVLIRGAPHPPEVLPDFRAEDSGTVIVWEKLDRIFAAAEPSVDAFFEIADQVSQHLGMVFHRFILGGKLAISINDTAVVPWDPFLTAHPECRMIGPEKIATMGEIESATFAGYILPSARFLTNDEFEEGGGPEGWTSQQGFYVYRENRLIVGGGWLGLGRAGRPWKLDRIHNLGRVRLDISNADDVAWQLDIKKSTAVPPPAIRSRLAQLAGQVRRLAKAAYYVHTPQSRKNKNRTSDASDSTIWVERGTGATRTFRINRRHPLVTSIATASNSPALRQLLDTIDRYAPAQPIGPAMPVSTITATEADVRKLARTVYYTLRRARGLSIEAAMNVVFGNSQFQDFEHQARDACEELEREWKGKP